MVWEIILFIFFILLGCIYYKCQDKFPKATLIVSIIFLVALGIIYYFYFN